jgi:hypothetical protein
MNATIFGQLDEVGFEGADANASDSINVERGRLAVEMPQMVAR